MDDQRIFESWVNDVVAHALERSVTTFADLIASLPGIYPEEVLRALRDLDTRCYSHLNGRPAQLVRSAGDPLALPKPASGLLGLPPPHPLDFEWRFAPSALDALTARVAAVTRPGGPVALVGTPTLALPAARALRRHRVDYYGIDCSDVSRTGASTWLGDSISVDLLRAVKVTRQYPTMVMDPPWYGEHVCRFLYFSAKALEVGGCLLLAMPAAGTRPGIERENEKALQWADDLGLNLEAIDYGQVPYETPPFERNALRAAGILNVGAEWRRGDLWVVRKRRDLGRPWPGDVFQSHWSEFRFGAVRVRVDTAAAPQQGDPCLVPIVNGDILSSVSRRDQRRSLARVWTTGNRIYGCDAPAKLAEYLSKRKTCANNDEESRHARSRLKQQIGGIVESEQAELAWPAT